VVCDIADLALMAISSGLGCSARRMKDQAPGDFDEVNNKDVNAFVPVKTVSFLWDLLRWHCFVEGYDFLMRGGLPLKYLMAMVWVSLKIGGGTRLFTVATFFGIASMDFLDLKGCKGKVFNGVALKWPGDAASLTGNSFLGLRVSLKGQVFELSCRDRLFLDFEGH
jgi:hypothetical protein